MDTFRKQQIRSLLTLSRLLVVNHRRAISRTLQILRVEGVEGVISRLGVWTGVAGLYPPPVLTNEEVGRIKARIQQFEYRPLISIVTPVHNVDELWLRKAIDSVIKQLYPHWELCIADDASSRPYIARTLEEYASRDSRIRYKLLKEHHHISATSNVALSMASGEYAALLDHDDELAPDALFRVVELLNRHPEADMIYTDEDHIHPSGKHANPVFKPNWSPDLLLSHMYTCHLGVYRRSLLEKIGGFRKGVEGSQDYDLVLRLMLENPKVFHIPRLLYHWRMASTSVAGNPFNKRYAEAAAVRALTDYLAATGRDAVVEPGNIYLTYHIRYRINPPLETAILIPADDRVDLLRLTVESILKKTGYPHSRLYVVINVRTSPLLRDYAKELETSKAATVLAHSGPPTLSAMNNFAAANTSEPVILFITPGMEPSHSGWLEAMVEHVQRTEVGVVGANLSFHDEPRERTGITLFPDSPAGFTYVTPPGGSPEELYRTRVIHNVTAVSSDCLMTRRETFNAVGGFDDENLATYANDVDFCLKVRELGLRITTTSYAEMTYKAIPRDLTDFNEKDPVFVRETSFFRNRWKDVLARGDQYHRPFTEC